MTVSTTNKSEHQLPSANDWWSIPNTICHVRLLGTFVLVALAFAGFKHWFIGLYVVLAASDFIDGILARRLNQTSDLGARLDSVADAVLNGGLIVGASVLCWEALQHELVWIGVALGSYIAASSFGLWKHGRLPSYHTYVAKTTQWIAALAAISLIMSWSVWPLRIACGAALISNLESIAITCVLPKWKTDVPSLFYIWPKALR